MENIIGYKGKIYKVLDKKQIHAKNTIYLIECDENNFAYGQLSDIQSLYFVPVNQYGTSEEIINHCKSIISLCEKHIKEIKEKINDINNASGWNLLIESNKNEIEALMSFISILESN